MPHQTRLPDELHRQLQQFRLSLELQHGKATPSLQDMITVAVQHLVRDWRLNNLNESQRTQLLAELLDSRETARSRMGRQNKTQKNKAFLG